MPIISSYQPFPVYDFKSGIKLDRAPWILPKDAFVDVTNAYLFEGRIIKRGGYELLWKMVHHKSQEDLGAGDSIRRTFTGILSHPLRPGNLSITDQRREYFLDYGLGELWGNMGGTGTIDYETGAYSITFATAPVGPYHILADYDWYPGLPVLGIWNYITSTGTEQLLVFDTRRMNYYDDVTKKLKDAGIADVFNATEINYIWMTNWNNIAYISNGFDRVKTWNGLVLENLLIDTDGDGNNNVTSALYVFPYKSRLVILKIEEDGYAQAQRARWSKVGTVDFSGDDFVDAPTNDAIMSAGFLRDELIVWFERSIWALRYTGSDSLPFRWVRLVAQEGSIAPMSLSEFTDEQLILGNSSIIGFDGRDAYNVADNLSNFVLNMNQSELMSSYGGVSEEKRQAWFSYPSVGSDIPDKILVYNYDDLSWSIYELPIIMVMGYYNEIFSPTWDDMDITWDEADQVWDEREFQAGFPRIIIGDHDGNVYWMDRGNLDNGANILASILTGRWNPFVDKGAKAVLGFIDFLISRNKTATLTIDFYMDDELYPYMSQQISLAGDEGESGELIWTRVDCGAEAKNHQIKVSDNSDQKFEIHAIVPYFKAGGTLR